MRPNKHILLTMFGHLCTDINQGALPALLPFLVLDKGLSYTSAAGLVFASNSMSSFVQPVVGYLGDKVSWPWLMGLGTLLAGCGLSAVGFVENYWAIFACVMVSGFGVALFHPEGGKIANLVSGKNKGAGISIFAVGGSAGFALGPVIVSIAVSYFGMKGTAVLLVPAVAMSLIIFASLRSLNRVTAESWSRKKMHRQEAEEDNWPAFFKVTGCLTVRSIVNFGLVTFIPLYFAVIMMFSEASASRTLTLFSVIAAAATLIGGQAADRLGFSRVIRWGNFLLVPLLLIFPLIGNAHAALIWLVPMAFMLHTPHAAMIATGQQFLPNHLGTSSGVMLGLTVSVGGMVAPAIGWIGDTYGLVAVMYTVAGFSVIAALCALIIPNPSKLAQRLVTSGAETGLHPAPAEGGKA